MRAAPPVRSREASPKSAASTPPAADAMQMCQARRRVSLIRVSVWAALAAGPFALAVWALSPRVIVQEAAAKPTANEVRSADPSGYAELFVDLWLRSDADVDNATTRTVRAMAPGVQLPSPGESAQPVHRAIAVRNAQLRKGAWSVTVAVEFAQSEKQGTDDGTAQPGAHVRYFAVPVTLTDGSSSPGTPPSFTVAAAPAEVPGPRPGEAPESPYRTEVDVTSPLASTVREFLRAYLTGVGQVDRYLAPGVRLPAVLPAPYDQVEVERVSGESGVADGRVSADGTSVSVQVQVRAHDAAGGEWPLAYTLRLIARAGRWEVSESQAGPGLTASQGAHADQSSVSSARDTDSSLLPAAGGPGALAARPSRGLEL